MKRMKICGMVFLLLALLLAGCSADALAQRGVDLLDELFAGDASEPRMTVRQGPEPSSSAPQADPEPAGQEPPDSQFPEAVEPAIPAQPPAGPEPAAPDPAPSEQPAGDITPSHTDATFFGPGESFRYLPKGVTGVYACTYASEDPAVASVDPDTGKVTAVGPGTTKVTMHVECNGQYDFSCIVRCNWKDSPSLPAESGKPADLPASGAGTISASHTDATFFNPKEHFQFLPVGAGAGYSCTYTTGDADVASVDEKGTVTAVGPGTTTVTMTVDGGGTEYIFECIVRCKWS